MSQIVKNNLFENRLKKRGILTIKHPILLIFLVMLFGCQSSSHIYETDLEKTIESKLSDETVTEIDLNEVTDFKWVKAYVFYPYTTERMINDQLGFSYDDPSNIELRDDITLLILVDKENKVHYAEVERKSGDLLNGEKEGYTPNNAIIKVTRNEGG